MVDEQFNKLYHDTKSLIRNISFKYHKRSGIPTDEFISQLNEELWLAYRDYDESKRTQMMTWVNTCLTLRAIDIMKRREGSYRRNVTHSLEISRDSEEGANNTKFNEASDVCVEDTVVDRIMGANQLALIDSLVSDPSKVDDTTRLIVETFPKFTSKRAIAIALGIHPETVDRKLLKLGRRYDSNRFGDIHDIIAV
jgi:DNA-directed RNA polymerase specialized sigma24 family protein